MVVVVNLQLICMVMFFVVILLFAVTHEPRWYNHLVFGVVSIIWALLLMILFI